MKKSEITEIGKTIRAKNQKLFTVAFPISFVAIAVPSAIFNYQLFPESYSTFIWIMSILGLSVPPLVVFRSVNKIIHKLEFDCASCNSNLQASSLNSIEEDCVCPKCGKQVFSD